MFSLHQAGALLCLGREERVEGGMWHMFEASSRMEKASVENCSKYHLFCFCFFYSAAMKVPSQVNSALIIKRFEKNMHR